MTHHSIIIWFRRDLRLADQAAFYHAWRDAERVVPLFILDPALLAPPHVGAARLHFLLESLRALDADLRRRGSYLVLRQGEPLATLRAVLAESNAAALYFNRDYVWPGRGRDDGVREALRADGVSVRTFQDQVLVEPETLLTGAGTPYTVYTPYRRAWERQPVAQPLPGAPDRLTAPGIASLAIPTAAELGLPVPHPLPEAGASVGDGLLAAFTTGTTAPILGYRGRRNRPDLDATSHLSPHLRFGTVGVRSALAAAHTALAAGPEPAGQAGVETWISELAWRDFYHQWAWHAPQVLEQAFDPALDDLPWENDPGRLAAWQEGRTGFPIVDAAMRQLNGIGWMHNRLRMIVASFLCKDLLVDWRLGERYFWERLVDGDKPANVGGWQWSASTGADPQPYFRIFNPQAQSERFDPEGAFIRKWVPELARLPGRYIHNPSALPGLEGQALGFQPGRDYPYPLVDHAIQRQRALALYAGRKKRAAPD